MHDEKLNSNLHDPGGERSQQLKWAGDWLYYEGRDYIQRKVDSVNSKDHAHSIIAEMYINLAKHPKLLQQVVTAKNPVAYLMTVLRRFAYKSVNKERSRSMIILTGEQGEAELRTHSDTTDLYKQLFRQNANLLRKLKFVLTPREYQVFIFRAYGSTERQVAQRLCLELDTVKGYSKTMRAKLRARGLDFFDVND